ncbi:MAG: PAS domain S-box protein [Acidobacteria bacterium]|nr:PAS domain S-box protein [Acidobacteriota bacterium]
MSDEIERLIRKVAKLEEENSRIKNELHQSQDLFSKIFHASSNVMAIHTIKEGRFVDINEAGAAIGGFKREELIGHTMEEYGLLDDPDLESVVPRKLREEGKVYNLPTKIRTKDGEIRTVLFSADPITINSEPCLLAVSVDITEREKEASALRQSEEKYRMLVENSLQGLTIVQDLHLLFCNDRFAAMWGYSPEDLFRLSPEDATALIHPDDRSFVFKRNQDLFDGKSVDPRYEYRGIRRNGTIIWVEAYGSVIQYGGKPAIQSVYMDITDRKKTESALRESEERFRLIAETIDEIFWIYDRQKGIATYLSPAFDRIWGFSKERIINNPEPFMDMVHPDDVEKVIAGARQLDEKQPISYEYRIIRPDGSIRNIWNRGYPIVEKDGRVLRYVGVGQDVTEWRHAEEALKESKEYLNQIINCIGDPIFVKDSKHRFVLVNDALCAFAYMPREQLLGSDGMPEEVKKALWEQEEAVLQTGREAVTEDAMNDRKGNPHILMTKKSLLTDKSGNKQIVGVMRDITEYKRLEAQFLQSQKMEAIGVLAGGVAHDFNNLLNVINGYSEMILEGFAGDESLRKDIEQIKNAGQRAAALTSQLLDFGRKQILQPEVFDLNHIIDDMSSMLRRLIGEHIELITDLQQSPAMINADPGKIQQVVMNLVVNARDAMPDGGKLAIETMPIDFEEGYIKDHPVAKPGPYILLAISDNGVGMDTITQERIFEPFFTTKTKGKGTGLGLSTVYGIVKQSEGFVWVYSEPGKGTTVKVYFPRSEGPVANVPEEHEPESEFRGTETLLIAEDETAVRDLACRILRDRGYTVLEAADGIEALRISQNYRKAIHLVVTDVVMPGMGGKTLVSNLEELRPGIKSLFISGYSDNAISHQGILDSNVYFLQKPFSIESLIRKIREVLDS